jgi:hypothetical protein
LKAEEERGRKGEEGKNQNLLFFLFQPLLLFLYNLFPH